MIELFNAKTEKIMSFEDIDKLLEYILRIEHKKQLSTRMQMDRNIWNFMIYSNQKLASLYWRAIKATSLLLSQPEQDAYEQGRNLLEICKGNEQSKDQIVITSEVNLEEMKRIWCEEYCYEHNYTIITTKH